MDIKHGGICKVGNGNILEMDEWKKKYQNHSWMMEKRKFKRKPSYIIVLMMEKSKTIIFYCIGDGKKVKPSYHWWCSYKRTKSPLTKTVLYDLVCMCLFFLGPYEWVNKPSKGKKPFI